MNLIAFKNANFKTKDKKQRIEMNILEFIIVNENKTKNENLIL